VKRLFVIPIIVAIQACASGGASPSRGEVPSGWPVVRTQVVVTAEFGVARGNTRHQGIDLSAPAGTPVWCTAGGKVQFAGKDGRYGKTVVVDHGGGYRTRYAHLKKIEVHEKERVKRGDVIGRVGKTGNATGTHLHYEVLKNGVAVNPRSYLD
jgi:murein DD-endopeptidase MepM/ murein hydrolase activator NlpD